MDGWEEEQALRERGTVQTTDVNRMDGAAMGVSSDMFERTKVTCCGVRSKS